MGIRVSAVAYRAAMMLVIVVERFKVEKRGVKNVK